LIALISNLLPIQFKYRLSKCGELGLGLFCTATPDSDIPAATLKTGKPVETSRNNGAVSVLLAHVVATKTRDTLVTDVAMDYPRDWETSNKDDNAAGHHEDGKTICIHSLAVLPAYQGSGIGRTIMMAYMQQMNGAGIADRLALIAHEVSNAPSMFESTLLMMKPLVPYYEKLGFVSKGPSMAQFGGGGWVDMVSYLFLLIYN
jgi:GNAT superfamily N-acetyltransferase